MAYDKWIREINGASAIILFVYTVTCAIVGRHSPPSTLGVPSADGETVHRVSFNPRKVLLYSLLTESLFRVHAAYYPKLTTISFSTASPTLRLPFMMFTFPAVNAAVLVGVGQSNSVWSVFSVVGMTLLMLCCAWTVSISTVQTAAVAVMSIIGITLYLATWILAWATTSTGLPFALVCFVIVVACLVITHCVLQITGANKPKQELFITCATLFIYILGQALWTAQQHEPTSPIVSPWVAFIITGILLIVFVVMALARMPQPPVVDGSTDEGNKEEELLPRSIAIDDNGEDDPYTAGNENSEA